VTQSAIPCILEAIKSIRCVTREAAEGKASKWCLSWYASMPAERCSRRTPQTWQREMWRAKETHVQLEEETQEKSSQSVTAWHMQESLLSTVVWSGSVR
jgi:hypothetical protein